MALKPITRQEQIIIGKNLEPITRMERFLKEYGGGGGGSVDWDDIKNKPFGDMPTGGDTLYWDGNTEGLATTPDGMFVKLSSAVVTVDDIANGYKVGMTWEGQYMEMECGADEVDTSIDGMVGLGDGTFMCAYLDNVAVADFVFPEKGIYVAVGMAIATPMTLTIPGYTGFPVTKKMEEKYLPGAVILYTDAEAEGYLYSTNDTSDTSKRMTKAELLKVLQSGNAVYLHHLDFAYCLAVTFIDLGDSMGVGFAISGEYVNAYTAEYVPAS